MTNFGGYDFAEIFSKLSITIPTPLIPPSCWQCWDGTKWVDWEDVINLLTKQELQTAEEEKL